MSKKLKIEKSERREKWNILRYDNVLEKEMLASPHIEIFGNAKICIDGCKGVYEYNETYIKLKLARGSLILCGNNFDIVYYEGDTITVKGKIASVEFCM